MPKRNVNTIEYWNRIWHMTGEHKSTFPIYQFALALMPLGAKFVDLGCGTGSGIKYLEANGLRGTGVDYVAYCKEYAPDVNVIIQDLQEKLPFKDNEFHLALCVMSFYCLEDPLALLKETWRILRPGGNLLIANPGTHTWKEEFYFNPTLRELYEFIKPVFPDCLAFKYKAWKVALATK